MENNTLAESSDQFEATIDCLSSHSLLPGRTYSLLFDGSTYSATITKLKHRLTGTSSNKEAVNTLQQGETGVVNISLNTAMEFQVENDGGANFELIDAHTKQTVAKGKINHSLRRATNIQWQALDIDKSARASLKSQRPRVVWLTGFSGSGKSTIANLVEKQLHSRGMHSYILDGDNVRHGLNKDLGFTDADRVENIRRIAETARLMVDAGLIVLSSFISPFRSERQMARELLDDGEFVEVFIDTPLEVCEQRDPKGLYKKVRDGQIKNFTGFDSPYEKPENPQLSIDTTKVTAEQAAEMIVDYLDA